MTAARSGTHAAPLAVPIGGLGAGVIWQGASLDGQRIFRLMFDQAWALLYAPIGISEVLTFKPVTTGPLYTDFCAALGMAYHQIVVGIKFDSVSGKQVIPASSDINDVTGNGVTATQTVTNGRRGRGKVSGGRANT